ncbi:sigma-54 dependent transcriptional regulator [Ponticaulis sp.]|uniref:nitrogen assimilation response regulator NtrX n=1 Tax=Ponticaulis sp. TaxID=2020902 RepID=UPI000B65AB7E|nr:sigma-54 dependent transcriptional regulator [Ponticaulis sp.]MAI89403.1 sigma-54-dependent Fis family transcriptional regulator [Ponticaulis sp.]OUY00442.1 MAG: sigma-54-dependent Fis family transcriptional regulator [Hyphomonadaceae bacterium TMED5]|tara:strand:- start:45772 stop:47154 length:1383 start_codon:yes stop_codon:yes gene_type:complete
MSAEILIVDDEPDIRDLIGGVLEDEGYTIRTAGTAEGALAAVAERKPDLVILDVWLQGSGMDGLEMLHYLKSIDAVMPVIVISGHGSIETAVTAIRRGAYDFLEKPFKSDRLLVIVERALETASLKRENTALKVHESYGEELLGNSAAATQLRQAIEKVAPTNSRILISGPSGAGKELAAKLIHEQSKRAKAPFVAVNAASITPEQMETELFGREAIDGRIQSVGLFEQAHRGTLFLDEIGEMPLGTQNKILRVLTEQRFRRVGGKADVSVDVRLVSSTTSDLAQKIEVGDFREDLYFRVNVVPLSVPPLSDRREDIPDLVRYFVRRSKETLGLSGRTFSDEAIAVLQSAPWPGNVRQLKNIIERVLILSGDNRQPVQPHELPSDQADYGQDAKPKTSLEVIGMTLRDAREQFEKEYLALQITRFGGNISRTAAFIGMERSALHRKLKTLGVDLSTSSRE